MDLPEEILLDSSTELRRVAGWKIYAWLVPLTALAWAALATIFLNSLSPLLWLMALLTLGDLAMLGSLTRELGLSLAQMLLIAFGAPVLGAALGAGAVQAGLHFVGRIRPREYLSEKEFRQAVASRFAWAVALPQVAVMVSLGLLALLPGAFIWQQLSYSVVGALAMMGVVAICSFFAVRGTAARANVLRLPSVQELQARAHAAPNPQERARLFGILFAQDRRHLPRNTTVVGPRFFLTSFLMIARRHWWVFLVLAIALAPMLWIADMVQAFQGIQSMGSMDPSQIDPQAGGDFSALETGLLILVAVVLACAAAFLPLAVIFAVPIKGREPRDLRTYPTVRERFDVNRWEKSVVWVGTFLWALVLIVVAAAYFGLVWALGEGATLHVLWIAIWVVLGIPLSVGAVYVALSRDLRTIVYGPAHWFARRATPTAAIIPMRGTKQDLQGDPRIAERKMQDQAQRLGLGPDATPDQVARAAASTGQLPDLGIAEDPYEPWAPGEPERTSEHSIPKGLDDLRR